MAGLTPLKRRTKKLKVEQNFIRAIYHVVLQTTAQGLLRNKRPNSNIETNQAQKKMILCINCSLFDFLEKLKQFHFSPKTDLSEIRRTPS